MVDVITVLTQSANPRRYWSDLKRKIAEDEGYIQLYENIVQLKLLASVGMIFLSCAEEQNKEISDSSSGSNEASLGSNDASLGLNELSTGISELSTGISELSTGISELGDVG